MNTQIAPYKRVALQIILSEKIPQGISARLCPILTKEKANIANAYEPVTCSKYIIANAEKAINH